MIFLRILVPLFCGPLISGTAGAQNFVPITIAATGHATVPVRLEGLGNFLFVLDTGAQGSVVYSGFAKRSGFEPTGESERLVAQTGEAEIPLVRLPRLSLGQLTVDSVSAVVFQPRADGVDLPGIVGLDVFGKSLLDFDIPELRIQLHDSGTRLSELSAIEPLRASRTAGDLLTVNIRINGTDAVAVIDTGARKTRINWVLGRKLGFRPDSIEAGDVIQGGTNTPLESGSAVVRNVELGARRLESANVLVADLPVFAVFGVDGGPAVILGMDWLSQTRMVIDFPELKVWFVAAG